MLAIYNHYSFVWIALGLTIVAGLVLLTNKPRLRDFISFGVIVARPVVGWLVLHPRQSYLPADARGKELWRTIGEIDPQKVRDSVAARN